MPPVFLKNSFFETALLTLAALPAISAPNDAAYHVWGYVLGSSGQFAHLSFNQGSFGTAPASTVFPFRASIMSIPTGQRFQFTVQPSQVLWGQASVAPSAVDAVFLSYAIGPTPLEELVEQLPAPSEGPERLVGPAPFWRQR